MKKLYINSFLFILPILFLLFFLPVKRDAKYLGLKDDCLSHGTWMHERIFENEKKIDIAFIGSSHTISAIDDRVLESYFENINITNLGYCRLGRNLSYIILKELLLEKEPKYLVLEVREDEDRYSHPIFPYMANTSDVVFPTLLYNRDILEDAFTHFSYKVELTQDFIYNKKIRANPVALKKGDFGFGTTNDTTAIEEMRKAKEQRSIPKKEIGKRARDFYLQFPRTHIKMISGICEEQGIELFFLYLPSYGTYLEQPMEYNFYKQHGSVLLPPQKILDNPDYWYDTNHFNPAGAKDLTEWMKKEIENKFIFERTIKE